MRKFTKSLRLNSAEEEVDVADASALGAAAEAATEVGEAEAPAKVVNGLAKPNMLELLGWNFATMLAPIFIT